MPPLAQPTEVEILVGLCTSSEWKEQWREWVCEAGVTKETLALINSGGELPQEVMVVYKRFLAEFDKALTRHCTVRGVSAEQLHLMCQEVVGTGSVVDRYLSLVLNQADFEAFTILLNEHVK